MADQQALEQKYSPVGQVISDFSNLGAKIEGIFMNGEKLVLKCTVPSKVVSNRVWDAIKQVDPGYSDFEIQMEVSGSDDQPYTIQSGDNLSKVSKMFYGTPNKYGEIAKHNGLSDPDKIQAGQTVNVPALS